MVGSIVVAAKRVPAWSVTVVALCVVVFFSLAVLVASGATRSFDLATIRLFQSVASYPLDLAVNLETVPGQLAVTLPLSVLLAVAAQRRLGGYAWLGPLFVLFTGAVEVIFKTVIAHPGPPREFIRAMGNPLGIPADFRPPFAFPSGHIARLTFLAVVASWLLFPRRGLFVVAAVTFAIVFGRVYIGDHWISDALAGVALGTGTGAAAIAWMRATSGRVPTRSR